jgi:hypothetical protein
MRTLLEKPTKSRWGAIMVFAVLLILIGRWSNGQSNGYYSLIGAVSGVIGVYLFALAGVFLIIAIENDFKKRKIRQ